MIKLLFLVLVAATYLAKGGDLKNQNASQSSQPQILFYRYFTPIKLASVATFIHYHHSLTPRNLTFLSAPKNYYRLMIVPLIQPAVTSANANLVIKMNVGLETTTFGAGGRDLSFVISDGSRFIGMLTTDKNIYNGITPCLGIEGTGGPTMSHRRSDSPRPKPTESY
ncbi:unnamed protein product [Porites lobata]|uniref:Dirigent protein n=1 Tax=Porites lobata TaxID=104759 RepID=A0ABN8PLI7_9CNID|nr:unnamed protein product [Porites lobata]